MAAGAQLDIAKVRGSFPALARDQVFFDNAGGSQTLGTVIDSIRDYLTNTNVQLGASYATGVKSTTKYSEGYEAAAKYINASTEEIVLGSSTTQLFRNVSYALKFSEGDEIVVSALDHEVNIAPWTRLRSLGHFFNRHDTLEDKLGLAGASYELVAAIPAVVSYLDGLDAAAVEAQETRLSETLLRYLNGRGGSSSGSSGGDVTIYGEKTADSAVRVPTIAFTVKGWSSRDLVEALEKVTNFGFRWGNFYSVRLIQEQLGLPSSDGVVRVSMVHYNTVEEVEAFVKALDKTLSSRT
ncbi:cysteine desulfurase [Magnaporthiopsis poae ATCC 64411]|uniref:Cysteine desulfurase n=1 Tax=Magnaporthiopsis poae (strain ATCC 64411 / 73-15) TaxID=644358 RepID=A0A0C4E1U2_MAGP6|nr:cysteine desulfurase [Magnaporthiopsis poae ATCC 64411]